MGDTRGPIAVTARATNAADWPIWLPISQIATVSCSVALATDCALAIACPVAPAAVSAAAPVRPAEALIASAVIVIAAVRRLSRSRDAPVSVSILSAMVIGAVYFSASARSRCAAWMRSSNNLPSASLIAVRRDGGCPSA
jgi:hypothetical protein